MQYIYSNLHGRQRPPTNIHELSSLVNVSSSMVSMAYPAVRESIWIDVHPPEMMLVGLLTSLWLVQFMYQDRTVCIYTCNSITGQFGLACS